VNQRTAEVLVAEIGVDMTRFRSDIISPAGRASVPATTGVLASMSTKTS
jgi:hypothetical protein